MTDVVTLCGSTQFKKEYELAAKSLGEQGFLVISVTSYGHADNINWTLEQKALLDAVHMQKILMSDFIYVLNIQGYIGDSTMREIMFAAIMEKDIIFHSAISQELHKKLEDIGACFEVRKYF